jgi:hypothetical protein
MYSQSKLKRLGIALLDRDTRRLRCLTCGEEWECRPIPLSMPPHIPYRGRLSPGYWLCTNGCNLPRRTAEPVP